MTFFRSSSELASIVLDIDPTFEIGPLTLTWHGLTIALGILIGGFAARGFARSRSLDPEELSTLTVVAVLAGLLGARLFFLAETDPWALLGPASWLATTGFAFNGALIAAALALVAFMRFRDLDLRYLDAVALGFPLGMAVGRIGDVILGEHFGPPTALPWGVRLVHPEAAVPSPKIAYHSGGLYEVVLAGALFAVLWPLRHRFLRRTMLFWTVVGSYGAGRFLMFFFRSDSPDLALGLSSSHWASIVLVLVAIIGATLTRMHRSPPHPTLPGPTA